MSALQLAEHLAACLDEDGLDVADLEHVFAAHPDLDVAYVRSWLTQTAPDGDRRLALLDDLERRFIVRA